MEPGNKKYMAIGPVMLAANADTRAAQKERKNKRHLSALEELQALRDAPKRPPVKTPNNYSFPFPTSPPNPPPAATPRLRTHRRRPLFDCRRCDREIYPITLCTCGKPRDRGAAWKLADNQWFSEDPQGWMDFNVPPRLIVPTLAQIDAQYEAGVAEDAQRRGEEAERARAPVRIAIAEAVAIAKERMIAAEEKRLRNGEMMAARAPISLVVMGLGARIRLRGARGILPPAEDGFHYIQEGGAIWLALNEGTESAMYVGDADEWTVTRAI
ncbi:hypothetical protein C8R46DRAFT_1232103 [Mycena filopes]|nr:hypothetical protein C8R46DRAFT_1232103 [Mycena filopes]